MESNGLPFTYLPDGKSTPLCTCLTCRHARTICKNCAYKLPIFTAALSFSSADVCSECCRIKVDHTITHPPPYTPSMASHTLPPNTTLLPMSSPPPPHPPAAGMAPPQLPLVAKQPPMYPSPVVPSPMPPFSQSLQLPPLTHAMTPVSSAAMTDGIMQLGLPTCEPGYVSPSGTHKPSATLCYSSPQQQQQQQLPEPQSQPEGGCDLLDLFMDPQVGGGVQGGTANATTTSFPGDFSEIKDISAGSPHSDVTCYSPVTTPISPNPGERASRSVFSSVEN